MTGITIYHVTVFSIDDNIGDVKEIMWKMLNFMKDGDSRDEGMGGPGGDKEMDDEGNGEKGDDKRGGEGEKDDGNRPMQVVKVSSSSGFKVC